MITDVQMANAIVARYVAAVRCYVARYVADFGG